MRSSPGRDSNLHLPIANPAVYHTATSTPEVFVCVCVVLSSAFIANKCVHNIRSVWRNCGFCSGLFICSFVYCNYDCVTQVTYTGAAMRTARTRRRSAVSWRATRVPSTCRFVHTSAPTADVRSSSGRTSCAIRERTSLRNHSPAHGAPTGARGATS